MKKLNTQDVFKAFRLVTKSGLKDKLTGLILDINKNGIESIEKTGIMGALTTLEVLTDAETEHLFYEWLSSPYELTAKEVAELDLETQLTMLERLYVENNLKSFFSALSGLMSKKH